MNRKSIIQEYVVLATNEKGKLSSEGKVGVIASAIAELILKSIIVITDKKVEIKNELPKELHYLNSFYEYLKVKPRKIQKVMSDYCMGITEKKMDMLIASVGESLVLDELAIKGTEGILGNKETYVPAQDYKEDLLALVKEEIRQEEEMSVQTMSLACILQETKCLKRYLSKYESGMLKETLKSLKKDPQNKELKDMIDYVEEVQMVVVAAMAACVVVIGN
jgi:hypothetical protein